MMKRFFLLLSFCFLCTPCFAQKNFDFSKISAINMDNMIEKMQKDSAYNEDVLVEMLFAIPTEYHQYIMPMVGNMRSISEKVRMMPGIVEWRRKLPTRLPPELAEFSEKHLKYLDPIYYPLLMPESWPSFIKQHEEDHEHDQLPMVLDVSTPEKMERVFPSSIKPTSELFDMMHSSKKTVQKDDKNAILPSDIYSVMNILEKFKSLENGTQGEKRKNIMLYELKDENVFLDAFVNPCESLFKRFEKIDTDGWVDMQLKKEKMSKNDYIQKCDRIVKAYRVKTMTSDQAKEIAKLTREAMALSEESFYRKVFLTLLHMHRTTIADMRALDGFDEQLKKTFSKKRMIMSTPFMLDF